VFAGGAVFCSVLLAVLSAAALQLGPNRLPNTNHLEKPRRNFPHCDQLVWKMLNQFLFETCLGTASAPTAAVNTFALKQPFDGKGVLIAQRRSTGVRAIFR
jgi:hypothetical protein